MMGISSRSFVFIVAVVFTCSSLQQVTGELSTDGTHDLVPPTCPANRTLTSQMEESDSIHIGSIDDATVFTNILSFINQNISLNTFHYNATGVYLMSEPVPASGQVNSIAAYGYLRNEDVKRLVIANAEVNATSTGVFIFPILPLLFGLVYRPDIRQGTYRLLHGPTMITHRFEVGLSATLDWPVREGDRIGVMIPDACTVNTTPEYCPSKVNLRVSRNECLSALYYNGGSDAVIPMSQFEEVLVRLNVQAVINQNRDFLLVGIVSAFLLATFCVVIVMLILCNVYYVRSRRKSRSWDVPNSVDDGVDQVQTPLPGHSNLTSEYHRVELEQIPQPGHSTLTSEYHVAERRSRANSYDVPVSIATTSLPNEGHYYSNDNTNEYEQQFFQPASLEEELMLQLRSKLSVTEIPREDVQVFDILGTGAFATVYRGVWQRPNLETDELIKEEVAVKRIGTEVSHGEKIKFLQEAAIMAQFQSNNIVSIRGILLGEPTMIVVELMRGGDLLQYLRTTVRNGLSLYSPLELSSNLLSYARQIVLGLAYLVSRTFVHRDLAARNVLVSADGNTCKLADFGLSCELQEADYYRSHGGKIPVRWMAPEAIKYRKYSHPSDIWSYGCVLYEIWSLGEKPYGDLNTEQLLQHLEAGYRLSPPPGCPRTFYSLMMKCWHPDADGRPTSCTIIQQLQKPDYSLLKWASDDVSKFSEEARTIGTPLQSGMELYPELQEFYVIK